MSDIRFFQLVNTLCIPTLAGKVLEQRFGEALPWLLCVAGRKAGRREAELDLGSTARLAQSVERKALNLVVVGSTPTVCVLPIESFAGPLLTELKSHAF